MQSKQTHQARCSKASCHPNTCSPPNYHPTTTQPRHGRMQHAHLQESQQTPPFHPLSSTLACRPCQQRLNLKGCYVGKLYNQHTHTPNISPQNGADTAVSCTACRRTHNASTQIHLEATPSQHVQEHALPHHTISFSPQQATLCVILRGKEHEVYPKADQSVVYSPTPQEGHCFLPTSQDMVYAYSVLFNHLPAQCDVSLTSLHTFSSATPSFEDHTIKQGST